ncbi:hypothetical protein HDU92_002640 [Lobulomyces angularis]|nr:hypothetical protein HDU92_002640 [Lobulomyces angularis]
MRISADLTRTESVNPLLTKDIKTAESFIHSNSNFTCNIKSSFSNLNFLSKDMENKLGRSNSELKMVRHFKTIQS